MTAAAASNNGADPGAGGAPNPGAANAPWYGEIPAERTELSEWVKNKGYKDPLSALESGMNLEKLIGFEKAGRTVVLPKDEKDVEGLKAFRAKLGVPESPDKYELPLRALKDGEQHTDQEKKFNAATSQWLLDAGVAKPAAHALVKNFNTFFEAELAATQKQEADAATASLEKLKGEWGGNFDKNAEYARRFLKGSGADDAWLAKYEQTFGTADMLARFHKWGSATGEHAFKSGDGGDIGMTLANAQAKLEEMRAARSSGAITDAQWKEGKGAEFDRLSEFVYSKKNNS